VNFPDCTFYLSFVDFAPYVNHTCIERNKAQDEALKTSRNNVDMMTCSRPNYDRSRRPAGVNDVMLGRKMGKGCQLKYADLSMHYIFTRKKFADADQDTKFTCTRWLKKWERDKSCGIIRKSPWAKISMVNET
jgi:hypothetical protein